MINKCIWVVIVAYHPEAMKLKNICDTLVSSGAHIVIVDNTEKPINGLIAPSDKVELIELGYNSGIAHAQNIGTTHALNNEASVVVYFDQDSIMDDKYLERLLEPFGDEDELTVRVPVVCDSATGSSYPSISVSKWGFSRKIFVNNSNTPVLTSIGVSSGTAVPSLIFTKVGLFDDSLFIDYVDTEWFLRCRFYSIAVLVIPRAVLNHRIGDSNIEKKYINLHIHPSKRVYYQVRNSIALLWMPHIPFIFSIREVSVTLIHKLFQTLYTEKKREHLRYILKGIFHGLASKSGSI